MKMAIRRSKDFWAGVLLAGTGAVSLSIARNYPFGTTWRMGPGYFPIILGGILILFGLSVMAKGMRSQEKIEGSWSGRALIILPLSLTAFGAIMEHAGFIPALVALVFGSAAAGRGFKFLEVLLLTVFLTIISLAVFIWGLGLPYPLIKGL